jgi:hypothetical protein
LDEIMKVFLGITLALLCFGCNTPKPRNADLDAVTAKAALLELMRSEDSPFEGADPLRFEKIELKEESKGKVGWGGFTLDLGMKTYSAQVGADTVFWSYQGKFLVDPSGRWKAVNVSTQHGRQYLSK